MVAAEVRIFNAIADLMEQSTDMRNQISDTPNSELSVSALSAVNEGINSAASLVKALADKNSTMGEGVPGSGPASGPGEPSIPKEGPPSGETTKKPGCYEKYRRRIEELWDQKQKMGDSVIWWLYWGDALKDLSLCAGPEAVKLLLELIGAAKK